MSIVDLVIIGLILVFVLLGLIFGFGKGLKFFTKGFIGVIISIFICYAIGGFILQIGFVSDLLALFSGLYSGKEEWYFRILVYIRVDLILYYIVLFIVVQIVRIIIVKIISKIMSSRNIAIRVVNKIFGVVLFLVAFVFVMMLAFQIICIVVDLFGETEIIASFYSSIESSLIAKWFYNFNHKIVEALFKIDGEWIWFKLIEIVKSLIIKKEEQIPVEGAIQFLRMYS